MEYKKIQEPVEHLLLQCNSVLHQCLKNRIKLVRTLYRATPIMEGKKIRTTFFFLLAGLNRISSPHLAKLAAVIEIYHLSSLIHDDIVDNSQLRRGRKTASSAFGSHLSVLWGDYLFISAFNLLREIGNRQITDVLIETSKNMIDGQILEYENSFNYQLTPRAYFEIIRKKTAALFSAIGRLVLILQGKPDCTDDNLARFGEKFGMMFQIRDDLLDLFSNHSGKDKLRDLQEGKVTLPYILFLKKNKSKISKKCILKDTTALRKMMQEIGVAEMTEKYLDSIMKSCQGFLHSYRKSAFKMAMLGLLDFVASRDY